MSLLKQFGQCLQRTTIVTADTLLSIAIVLAFSKRKHCPTKTVSTKPLLVLGNGPSLAEDISSVTTARSKIDAEIWCVNNFALSDSFRQVSPNAYVLADPNYWLAGRRQSIEDQRQLLIEKLNSSVHWPMTLYIPGEAKGSVLVDSLRNRLIDIQHFNRMPVTGFAPIRHALYDTQMGMPIAYNVLIAALSLAIQVGYRKIYLAGADHSWHEELSVNGDNLVLVAQAHFYDQSVIAEPVYKAPNAKLGIGELFRRWGDVFIEYEVVNTYAAYKGADIVNISRRSYIDAFPRQAAEIALSKQVSEREYVTYT